MMIPLGKLYRKITVYVISVRKCGLIVGSSVYKDTQRLGHTYMQDGVSVRVKVRVRVGRGGEGVVYMV